VVVILRAAMVTVGIDDVSTYVVLGPQFVSVRDERDPTGPVKVLVKLTPSAVTKPVFVMVDV
jgi:hypothetical protein